MDQELFEKFDLARLIGSIDRYEKPAIAFQLSGQAGASSTRSKLSGFPLLPDGFSWPSSDKRALDFLLQIDLAEVAGLDPTGALPPSGLLTFFYDLEDQPWSFDPAHLDGFRVEYFPEQPLSAGRSPDSASELPEHGITFRPALTLPYPWSRPFEKMTDECQLSKEEVGRYRDFIVKYNSRYYPGDRAFHRLLGHSQNIQGDMQLEAQLVTHGLYCGDPSGYNDPRAKELEPGADDWLLLLQLDSDDVADLMWGDAGMLYFWIRSEDLANRRFDRVWMSLQCY